MRKPALFLSLFVVVVILVWLPACDCSESSEESESTTSGFLVSASLTGAAQSAEVAAASTFTSSFLYVEPDYSPDSGGGGVSATLSPEGYTVALKKLTLLGDDDSGTSDYEVFSTEDVEEAYVVDFVNDTTFFDSDELPDPGTYDGIEIELFYIEMDADVYIPRLNYTEASGVYTFTSDVYTMRGYFHEVDNVQPRDVTVFWDDPDDDPDQGELEYWIDRQYDHDVPFGIIAVTEERPPQTFDLWADEVFWGTEASPREPLTIATTEEFSAIYGTEFHFDLAEGTTSFTIPEDSEGTYELNFEFNVQHTLTWWEYVYDEDAEVIDASIADGEFAVGFDSGYRIFFPDVIISIEEPTA
ncbi:MAG: hypothetical protein SVY53_04250 [Chloroflexota bacterium]|nr:hypothetical protein [Chloroflexota bacterium]